MLYHICGPYKSVVNTTKIDAVDAIVWREPVKGTKEYMYDVILESGERICIDGFSKWKDADEDRNDLLSEGMLIDLEEEDVKENTVYQKNKTLKEAWEADKDNIIKESDVVLKENDEIPMPKIIPLTPEVAGRAELIED